MQTMGNAKATAWHCVAFIYIAKCAFGINVHMRCQSKQFLAGSKATIDLDASGIAMRAKLVLAASTKRRLSIPWSMEPRFMTMTERKKGFRATT